MTPRKPAAHNGLGLGGAVPEPAATRIVHAYTRAAESIKAMAAECPDRDGEPVCYACDRTPSQGCGRPRIAFPGHARVWVCSDCFPECAQCRGQSPHRGSWCDRCGGTGFEPPADDDPDGPVWNPATHQPETRGRP